MQIIILLLLLIGCSSIDSRNGKVGVELKNSWPNKEWQEYVYEKAATLPRTVDEKEFCPNGLSQENYVHLMAAMVKYESGFNPAKTYLERFKNGRGERVVSTGLFQVSYESSRGYGFKGITTEELKDPYKNIDVAVAIIKKWTERDGVVANHSGTTWRGGARYWSVLRTTGKLQSIKNYMKPYCQ